MVTSCIGKKTLDCLMITRNWYHPIRAIFNREWKVIRDWIGFALLRIKGSLAAFPPKDEKLKPIANWSLAFSRASDWLDVFNLSCHWLLGMFAFVLIDLSEYFGFGFAQLN